MCITKELNRETEEERDAREVTYRWGQCAPGRVDPWMFAVARLAELRERKFRKVPMETAS
jgi:hypothetical protein